MSDEDVIRYRPIGEVRSPFERPADVPKTVDSAVNARGTVVLDEAFADGLTELDGFSHIVLLTHLHLVDHYTLRCNPPFADDLRPGIFATRGPNRPNPIGHSIVRLLDVDGETLSIADVDLVDRTPVLDIKPFAPKPHEIGDLRGGWIEEYLDHEFANEADEYTE